MKKINESFQCTNCKTQIQPARGTCRNHCPKCFVSLHVDGDIPWDRASSCWWKMYPIEYFISNWEVKISFQCVKCGKIHRNKACEDDELWQLDEMILKYKKILSL